MKKKISCDGCCSMTKAGVEVYRCDQTECPFWKFFFVQKEQKLPTCFT